MNVRIGDRVWDSVDALLGDASAAAGLRNEVDSLRSFIGALAAEFPNGVRVKVKTFDAHLKWTITFDASDKTYLLSPHPTTTITRPLAVFPGVGLVVEKIRTSCVHGRTRKTDQAETVRGPGWGNTATQRILPVEQCLDCGAIRRDAGPWRTNG